MHHLTKMQLENALYGQSSQENYDMNQNNVNDQLLAALRIATDEDRIDVVKAIKHHCTQKNINMEAFLDTVYKKYPNTTSALDHDTIFNNNGPQNNNITLNNNELNLPKIDDNNMKQNIDLNIDTLYSIIASAHRYQLDYNTTDHMDCLQHLVEIDKYDMLTSHIILKVLVNKDLNSELDLHHIHQECILYTHSTEMLNEIADAIAHTEDFLYFLENVAPSNFLNSEKIVTCIKFFEHNSHNLDDISSAVHIANYLAQQPIDDNDNRFTLTKKIQHDLSEYKYVISEAQDNKTIIPHNTNNISTNNYNYDLKVKIPDEIKYIGINDHDIEIATNFAVQYPHIPFDSYQEQLQAFNALNDYIHNTEKSFILLYLMVQGQCINNNNNNNVSLSQDTISAFIKDSIEGYSQFFNSHFEHIDIQPEDFTNILAQCSQNQETSTILNNLANDGYILPEIMYILCFASKITSYDPNIAIEALTQHCKFDIYYDNDYT